MKQAHNFNTKSSLNIMGRGKLVHSITELGRQVMNHSLEIDSISQNSADSQQVLKMEIKQLKRENAFLKTKIQELKKGVSQPSTHLLKRQSLNCMNILKKRPDPKVMTTQSSLDFILKQIESVLKSLGSLYRVQIEQKRWILQQSSICQNIQPQTKKLVQGQKQYRKKLQKRLQMLGLSKEQSRYEMMLDIFFQYYQMKNSQEVKIKERMEKFIERTIQISKKLIEKANAKLTERSIRSSCIHSVYEPQRSDISEIVPSIKLNDSCIFKQQRLKLSEKHELSYSTIDGQNNQKQID